MYFLEDLKEEEKQLLELNKNITKDIIPSIKASILNIIDALRYE